MSINSDLPQVGTNPGQPPTPPAGTITIPAPQAPPPTTERTFTAEDIENARRQERDKLYGRMTEQGEELKTFKQKFEAMEAERQREAEAAAAAKAQADKEAAEAARVAAEAEMSAKDMIKQERDRWEREFAQMREQQEQERALFEKDRAFNELRAYAQAQATANQDDIAPELLDLIGGNSREEIDASVTRMKEKTSAILQGITEAQAQRPALRGTAPTGRPNIGPLDNTSTQRTLTPQQIRDMPFAEYAANREALLAAASNQVRSNGLYG